MDQALGNLLPHLKLPEAGRLGADVLQDIECDDKEELHEWIDDPQVHVDDTEPKRGQTALIYAARKGSVQCVSALINAGADLDVQAIGGATATYIAAQENQLECLKLLVTARAKLDVPIVGGATALHVATRNRNLEAMRLLVDFGASMNPVLRLASVDVYGATPLSLAVYGGSEEAV